MSGRGVPALGMRRAPGQGWNRPKEMGKVSVLNSVQQAVEHTGAEKVYGIPITQDGVTVLPVAKVSGGGGGGEGPTEEHRGEGGSGGGLGVAAKPLGVFVLKDGKVTWRPTIDVNRIILGGQIVAIVALLVIRGLVKARMKANAS
jgi:uncharacterized spore protein YtfJ